MTPAMRRGATAAPRFVDPRFRADPWVSEGTLRNRGRAMSLRDPALVPRLDEPSLVSSAHGRIDRVLFTLPWWLFLTDDEASPDELEQSRATVQGIRNVMRQLPRDTRLLILAHESATTDDDKELSPIERLATWLSEDGLSGRAEIVAAPPDVSFTMWAEDAYAVSLDLHDGETFLVEPSSFRRADDAYVADLLAPKTDLERAQVMLYFQGGNLLVGDDFWLIGMDYPTNSLGLGYVKPRGKESEAAAIARAYGEALDKGRKLITVGARVPVPGYPGGELVRDIELDGTPWRERLYCGNESGTVQPIFHIDMFLTLAGRDESGKYIVLAGDPRMAARILGQPLPRHAMAPVFDDIAGQLDELGFRVVRNPLPLTHDDDEATRWRTWYFATANNALVQVTDTSKDVWLPTYGHRKWPELAATDAANRRIWEGLGFTAHDLGDFHSFAVNQGAAHCMTKYLARR